MNEADMMRKDGKLFTNKQYKKCLFVVISSLVISGIITFAGLIVALATNYSNIIIAGVIIGAVGFVLLMISLVFTLKQAGKIQLYRYYKKHSEDFNNDVEQKTKNN